MKAMILAAGEGARLRPLTEKVPKPMIEIAGRPVLEHNVRLLARHGIRDIIINLHHRPDAITQHFGDGTAWGVSITYSREPRLLGTAGALKKVEDRFDGTFLVLYGDNLTTCDLTRLVALHRERGAIATMALFEREDPTASGIVGLGVGDRVTRFLEKPRRDEIFSHWVNAGVLAFEPEVFKYVPNGGFPDFGRDVLPALLAASLPVYGFPMRGGLWWIDTLDDYRRVKTLFENGEAQVP